MKNYLPLLILSILFYWISARSYVIQSSELESLELFRLLSNVIALFVPLVLFVYPNPSLGLRFSLQMDEKRQFIKQI